MVTKNQYLANPCRAASVPYWKMKTITVPKNMKIVHDDYFDESEYPGYVDEPYFRLYHSLKNLPLMQMPDGFSLCDITVREFAKHINGCYDDCCVSEAELQSYTSRAVYNAELWIAVKDNQNGAVAATGIAELDREIGEGVLEWIQVSEEYRGLGLGSYIVSELLRRMKGLADFVTVSGKCSNRTKPEGLYRKCGFTGNDVWHILRK